VYTVYDPVIVYFAPYKGYYFELWSYHSGQVPQLLSAGVSQGATYYVKGTVGPPAGYITFELQMNCSEGCDYCGMCEYGQCTIYVEEYVCDCPNQCYGDDLWAMKCVNGVCTKDYIIEENSEQCGYDPCKNVTCDTVCRGYDLWSQRCVDGSCVDDTLLEMNSVSCGYDPCENINCRDVCRGYDLWSQKCVDGDCVDDQLLEANSVSCGYDPCENHCTNGQKDCGEYGVDCGGGCPIIDSDADGVEDCVDQCPNSRCNKVDSTGCETDVDQDGVLDCEDDCPHEKGNANNQGCPNNMNWILLLGGLGGVVVVGGGLALWGMKSGGSSQPLQGQPKSGKMGRPISRPTPQEIAARKEAAEKIAQEVAQESAQKKAGAKVGEEAVKQAGKKVGEEASKQAGTKVAEEASKQAGTKVAEEASKQAGTKVAEEASKQAGTKVAEEASKQAGTKIAEETAKTGAKTAGAASGAGLAGTVAKQKEVFCPNCGEKLPPDSKFCSNCGYTL
jgi:hypothetical protein